MGLANFGRNVRFHPRQVVRPRTRDEVLAALEACRGRSIRAIGCLHSWNEAIVGDDVVLDMRRLRGIRLTTDASGRPIAEIEAGCTIGAALDFLRANGSCTLPTYGMAAKQTIAGAIATGTHGSGLPSLSHYVAGVSIATYDRSTGRATIVDCDGGDELRAARCALGGLGVVVAVRIGVVPEYLIDERTEWHASLRSVLLLERAYGRTQSYLVPWSWRWFVQWRRPVAVGLQTPGIRARLQRVLRRVGVDILLNGLLKVLASTRRSQRAIPAVYRRIFPLVLRPGVRVVDEARPILMMRHDFFRHVEMELFVPAAAAVEAADWIELTLRTCGGEQLAAPGIPPAGHAQPGELDRLRGTYVHDHVITVRRVLPDDTLISMTSGSVDAWYAFSLVTYQRDLRAFFAVCDFLARTMGAAYGARPHWGKVWPATPPDLEALYPALDRFRAVRTLFDPDARFVNEFLRRTIGVGLPAE